MVALLWQEVRDVLTVPAYATNSLTGMIVFPLMLCLALFSSGETGGLQEIKKMLAMVPSGAYLAVVTGILGLMGSMCMAASTAVSREGKCHELRKTYPVSGAVQLRAKVYMGMVFNVIGMVVMVIILCVVLPEFWTETLLAALCALPLAFLLSITSVIVDAHFPKLNWKTEIEAVKQNMNAMIGMLLSMVLIALLVGAFVLLMKWGMGWTVSLAVAVAFALLLDVLAILWLNHFAANSYLAH